MNILNFFSEKNPNFWKVLIIIMIGLVAINWEVLLNFDGSIFSYISIIIFVILFFAI